MNADVFNPLYDNDASIELLRELNKPQFTDDEISKFPPDTAEAVIKSQAELASNPVIAIRRMAAEGSQSRFGGTILKGSSGLTITLRSGAKVTVASVGDHVEYPDGKTAQITNGGGRENFNIALVGSCLDNGDKIINTPQDAALITIRKNTPLADDFLPNSEDE